MIEGRDVFLEVAPRPASDESQRGNVVVGCGQFELYGTQTHAATTGAANQIVATSVATARFQ